MPKLRTPCKFCGGEKPPGRGRRACDPCNEKAKPIWDQQLYAERNARRVESRKGVRMAETGRRRFLRDAPEGQKWCPRCQQFLALAEFQSARNKTSGLTAYCEPCQSAYNHEKRLRTVFNITPEDYEDLLEIQGGRCAVCECRPRSRRLAVDHDHSTGAIRGLLCTRCNHKVIGAAKESAPLLRRAARYLEHPVAVTRAAVPAHDDDLISLRIEDEMRRVEAIKAADPTLMAVVVTEVPGAVPADWYVTLDGASFIELLKAVYDVNEKPASS